MAHLCKQGVILAAGMGKRLGEYDHPKSLFKFNNKTLLERNIEALFDAGIKEVIVVGGYKIEMLEPIINKYKNVTLIHNIFYKQYQTMQSLGLVEDFIEQCFVQTEADFVGEPRGLKSLLNNSGNSIICSEQRATDSVTVPTFTMGKLDGFSRSLRDTVMHSEPFNYVGPSHFTKNMLSCMKKHNENNNQEMLYEEALAEAVNKDGFDLSFIYVNDFKYWDLNRQRDFRHVRDLINMLDGANS
jgi:choline kinase